MAAMRVTALTLVATPGGLARRERCGGCGLSEVRANHVMVSCGDGGAARSYQHDIQRQARTLMAAADGPFSPQHWKDMREQTGFNAVALGAEATSHGVGHLFGNPHFPWFGALRFYIKPWGHLQVAIKASPISVHGGEGTYGGYNAIRSSVMPQASGVRIVNYGTSDIQSVTWDGATLRAEAFLTYLNSTNPGSPNYGNQTLAFMAKQ